MERGPPLIKPIVDMECEGVESEFGFGVGAEIWEICVCKARAHLI